VKRPSEILRSAGASVRQEALKVLKASSAVRLGLDEIVRKGHVEEQQVGHPRHSLCQRRGNTEMRQ